MDINLLNKMLDDKDTKELLLESTRKQLNYILNYKSIEERCDKDCRSDCECKEEEYEDEYDCENESTEDESIDITVGLEDPLLKTLYKVGEVYDLSIFSFNSEDNGKIYVTFKPQ
jgi:hypothetical protein